MTRSLEGGSLQRDEVFESRPNLGRPAEKKVASVGRPSRKKGTTAEEKAATPYPSCGGKKVFKKTKKRAQPRGRF